MSFTFGDWFLGEVGVANAFQFRRNGSAFDLTGYASVVLRLKKSTDVAITGTGVVTVTSAGTGEFTYAPAANEIDTPGAWYVQPRAVIGGITYYGDWISVRVGELL